MCYPSQVLNLLKVFKASHWLLWQNILAMMLLLLGGILWWGARYVQTQPKPGPLPEAFVQLISDPAPVPLLVDEDLESLKEVFVATLSAESIWVSDEISAQILLTKNPDQPRALASTTKLMTALVARKLYSLDEVVTVGQEAFTSGNVMGLEFGEQMRVGELLYGLLIPSGNDAAFVLANHHSEGYLGFVADMNSLASELRLSQSHFENPSGLDQSGHLATAHDLAILAREVFKDPLLRQIMGTAEATITDVSGQVVHPLQATHQLLRTNPQVIGGKTGTTYEAGETLITLVEIQGHVVQIVVMKSQDRYADTSMIIEWIGQHYTWPTQMQ